MGKHNNKRRFESKLTHSLRSNGYLFPVTINQVNYLEYNHKDMFKNAPPAASSIDDILSRGIVSFTAIPVNDVSNEFAISLAQAAREGKEIPEEIRKQMEVDRKKAISTTNKSDSQT